MHRGFAILLALVTVASPATARRIVSTNPCVDAILMQVADPADIAAISNYSHDPRSSSISAAEAQRFRGNSGSAEELIALRPDLVIADTLMAPATVQTLKRLHVPLLQLPAPASLSESRKQIAAVAGAAGYPQRGAFLNRRIAEAVARGRIIGKPPVSVLIWQGSGLVLGTGTLADALIRNAGFVNHSPVYGFGQWGVVSVEALVANPPALILMGGADADAGSAGDRMLNHPALRALNARIAVRPFPSRLFRCGGPSIIAAAAALADVRRRLPR